MNKLVEEYKYIKSSKPEWKFVNFKNFRNVLENFKEMFKVIKILNNKWKVISRHPNGGVRPLVPSPT